MLDCTLLNICTHFYSVFQKSTGVHIPWHTHIHTWHNLLGNTVLALLYKEHCSGTVSCLLDRLEACWSCTYRCICSVRSLSYTMAVSFFHKSSVHDHLSQGQNRKGKSNRTNHYTCTTLCLSALHRCYILVGCKSNKKYDYTLTH